MTPGPGASPLPQLQGRLMVTDGGMETDLIFHHGVDLPHFAAFPLLDTDRGRALLAGYYDGYAAIARRAGAGLVLESPTCPHRRSRWRVRHRWPGDSAGRCLRSGLDSPLARSAPCSHTDIR